MRVSLLDYVGQIRTSSKYSDFSRDEIRRLLLAKGECHLPIDFEVTLTSGEVVTTELNLNIATRSETIVSWTMSLKLHGYLIDCVDWEQKFPKMGGGFGRGWHRHVWDAASESAKSQKIPVDNFENVETRDEFVVRGLSLFNVTVNRSDHGHDLLFS